MLTICNSGDRFEFSITIGVVFGTGISLKINSNFLECPGPRFTVDSSGADIDLVSRMLFDSNSVDSAITVEGDGQEFDLLLIRITPVAVGGNEGFDTSAVHVLHSAFDILLSPAVSIGGANEVEGARFAIFFSISLVDNDEMLLDDVLNQGIDLVSESVCINVLLNVRAGITKGDLARSSEKIIDIVKNADSCDLGGTIFLQGRVDLSESG